MFFLKHLYILVKFFNLYKKSRYSFSVILNTFLSHDSTAISHSLIKKFLNFSIFNLANDKLDFNYN